MKDLPTGWAVAPLGSLIAHDGIFTDGDWVESKDQDPNGEVPWSTSARSESVQLKSTQGTSCGR